MKTGHRSPFAGISFFCIFASVKKSGIRLENILYNVVVSFLNKNAMLAYQGKSRKDRMVGKTISIGKTEHKQIV